jgi:two-component sensor histidine kinase
VGLYNLGSKQSGDAYLGDEIHLLHLLGRQAAVAVENSRLYEQARQEIAERRRAEEQLKASLAEKEILLKEIHHRVKNNLQVISSLLYLQSKSSDDARVLALLSESRHRLRSMALIHEQLYQTEHLDRVLAPRYLRSLTSYLSRSYGDRPGRARLRLDVDDIWLTIDVAVPCGLLVNELLSNALKHAFTPGTTGEALVALKAHGESDFKLVVADDGVGLPRDLDLQNAPGLGLQLVQMLVRQLEGILHVSDHQGTRFEITFPAPSKEGEQVP